MNEEMIRRFEELDIEVITEGNFYATPIVNVRTNIDGSRDRNFGRFVGLPVAMILDRSENPIATLSYKDGKFVLGVSEEADFSNDEIIKLIASVVSAVEKFSEFVETNENAFKPEIKTQNVEVIVDGRVRTLRPITRVIEKLRDNQRLATNREKYHEGVREAMDVYAKFFRNGWKIVTLSDGKRALKYEGRIEVEFIVKDGRIYEIPPELRGRLYAEGIIVPIKPTLTEAYVERSCHPNVSRGTNGTVCLGEGNGVPLSQFIETIEGILRTANLDSPFGNTGKRVAYKILEELGEENRAPVIYLDDE